MFVELEPAKDAVVWYPRSDLDRERMTPLILDYNLPTANEFVNKNTSSQTYNLRKNSNFKMRPSQVD